MLKPVFLPQAFSPDECARLIAAARARPLTDARLVRGTSAEQIRRAEVAWVDDLPDCDWVMTRMIALTARTNRESFGFELTEFGESAQVAHYSAARAGHFGWHADIGAGTWAARRKLTIVVQLSDPASYAGGDLELWPEARAAAAPRALGHAVAFPSFLLHRVSPVTRGERFSLTLWAHGPAFR